MRQAGYLAAAGIYALENHIDRLQEDHDHAVQIAEALKEKEFVSYLMPVETNIIIFGVQPPHTAYSIVEELKKHQILSYAFSPTSVRLVLHLDITPEMVEKTITTIKSL
jgi:threonine aldolase